MTATLYTIGHGSRTAAGFLEVLQEQGIEVLADVRRYPGSRRHPHFGRQALNEAMEAAGIEYRWEGEALGGRRSSGEGSGRHRAWRIEAFRAYASHMETETFRAALTSLLEMAAHRRVAVMCAETLWWKCHRRLIADAAVVAGARVVHLGPGEPEEHELSDWARVAEDGAIVYDAGTTPPLE